MFTKQTIVRFSECDGLGHVNNTTYYIYMEEARVDLFRLFIPSLDLTQWNLIVASTRCDYLQQVKFAEIITTYTWISHIGKSSMIIEHALQNDQNEWVARGQAVMIYYNYETQKAESIPEAIKNTLMQQMESPINAPDLRG